MFDNLFEKLKTWSEQSIIDEVIIIALIIAVCETIAQNLIKTSESNSKITMFFGLTFYIIVGFLLHHAYNNYAISKVNVIWSSISIIVATMLGYFIYKEHMTPYNFLSVIAATLAVYFGSL
jgi:multidrug transporter EmrE-like cation transporter